MTRTQRLLATVAVAVGVVLALVAGIALVDGACRVRFAENVMLRSEPRAESHWQFVETGRGTLIRVASGRFRGWYLACDDRVEPQLPPVDFSFVRNRFPQKAGSHVRNLTLREKKGADCFWRVTGTDGGFTLQATHGRYANWYLDFIDEYVPDTDREPPSAWNLVLNPNPVPGTTWTITQSAAGRAIRATTGNFRGWYLDAITGAKIIERRLCWGEDAERDRQEPPLAR